MIQLSPRLYSWAFHPEASMSQFFPTKKSSFCLGDGLGRDHTVSEELQSSGVFLTIQLSIDSLRNFCCSGGLCFQCYLFCDHHWSSQTIIFLPTMLSELLISIIHLFYNPISLWAAVKRELLNLSSLCWCLCTFLYSRIKWITSGGHCWET